MGKRDNDSANGPLNSLLPCSTARILDHMVVMKAYDYSISDISRMSGVGIKTALRVIHRLESRGILTRTRTVGRSIMFTLNTGSRTAKMLERLAFMIASDRVAKAVAPEAPVSRAGKRPS